MGLGGKDTTSITAGNATGHDVSNSIGASVNLTSGATDYFVVNIYYDAVFGTFAFQQEAPATQDRLTGSGSAAGQPVTLTSGKKIFRTVTGKDGKFTFRSRGVPAGPAMLAIGNQPPKPATVPAMADKAS